MTRKLLGVAFSALLIGGVLARPQDPPPVQAQPPITDPAAPVPAVPQKQEIPAPVKEVWDAAETWTLYSLAPEQKIPAPAPEATRGKTKAKPKPTPKPPAKTAKKRDVEAPFHGVVVLGKREIKKDDAIGTTLKDAMYASMEKGSKPSRCFIPHHGIRAVVGDKTLDLVICFTCHYMDIYLNGEKLGERMVIDPAPFSAFDQALTEAQIPMGQRGVKKPAPKKKPS